ncbi:SDR family oxidoreductase [Aliivibrio finisterrensis]|uniref:SDR family oxidoreductase n=1 Tax=Aliivibrio finisterrensis TaxID=511998 RepID=A0A4V1Z7S7_9GAMM|nr:MULTISPECIES: SDR family oxidoreductase [Aliivibrio]MDD9173907.1 SDR family oxidoreductase [Aliivibrio sp. S3TY1]MDD9190984.1 SDR family oxidoreductase [Aliivibrio sp. S2TY2]RYU46399.1 SDR family oxidoreductase [Aliivibrio finisterrensis]
MTSISVLGCGWLGLPLAKHLVTNGFAVKGSVRSEEKIESLEAISVTPYVLDIDGEITEQSWGAFLDSDILVIAIPSKNQTGFSALIRVLESSSIKHVVFVSSTSVYADNNGVVTEDIAASESSALFQIESLFYQSSVFTTTVIRFSGLVGYQRNPGRFFQKSGRSVNNPDAAVNMIHQDDCVELITQIIKQEKWNDLFNACADSHPSKREFYTQATQRIGVSTPEFIEADTQTFKIISNEKIKKALGYEFIYPDVMQITYDEC